MHVDFLSVAALIGGTATVVCLVSVVGLSLAYRRHYANKLGIPCVLPLFRLRRVEPTIFDNIRHLEFRDPLAIFCVSLGR